ncbi:response regulator [Paenibacillus dendritiformis]|uniref:response regulator n=1 Tax=Paenibacillus dendritiformis TaxID=130049 RepID=UPI00248C84E8|nr:response regulator [Paenibacillus dendritiformis]WGU92210.1 response regulator [Paenibacillus dendritiformis]
MKLRTKLIIGYVMFMIIILALGWYSFARMGGLKQDLDHFYRDSFQKVELALSTRDDANAIARDLVTELLNPDKADQSGREVLDKVDGYKERINRSLEELTRKAAKAEEKQMVEAALHDWGRYDQFVTDAIRLSMENEYEQANQMRNEYGLDYQNYLLNSLGDLARYHEAMMDDQVRAATGTYEAALTWTAAIMLLGILVTAAVTLWVIPSVTRNLNTMSVMMRSLARGRMRVIQKLEPHTNDEIGEVIHVFKQMAEDIERRKRSEEQFRLVQEEQAWMDANIARVTELLNGAATLNQVGETFVSEFVPTLGAQYGALYIRDDLKNPDWLHLCGAYAANGSLQAETGFRVGEGLVGQCAHDEKPIYIHDLKNSSLRIQSGLCDTVPGELIVYPIIFESTVIAVLELASVSPLSKKEQQLLEQLADQLGVIIHSISGRLRVEELLRESQTLTEELQCQSEELLTQQEEMRRSNEHLEAQTEALKRSEEMLQRQQEELEHYNTELIAKTRALEEQMLATQEKNEELEAARKEMERQALQLALASKYKSEFLANMSHELRTPLNSLLVLSQLLSENKEGNLEKKQIEYARTIHMSGSDLLKMIDEILDLSKVDAGKMHLNYEKVHLSELTAYIRDSFSEIASQKGLRLEVHMDENVPDSLVTDGHRVMQIIRNLMSNAVKFTNRGSVAFHIGMAAEEEIPVHIRKEGMPYFAMRVTDTGIGIPEEKQDLIFEAFQQLDGTTSRKYGGAGLGLSISRELARLLGGTLAVESKEDEGSTFTFYLPVQATRQPEAMEGSARLIEQWNEKAMASAAAELSAAAGSSPAEGPALADPGEEPRDDEPAASPDRTWKKSHREWDNAVIHEVAAAAEQKRERVCPLERKKLLIVEDDGPQRQSLIALIEGADVEVHAVSTGTEALKSLTDTKYDGLVLDLLLPDMNGFELLDSMGAHAELSKVPVIVYTGKLLDKKEELELKKRARSIIIKDVKSPERLLQETMLLLNRSGEEEAGARASGHASNDQLLAGKRILLVDDDVRNVFALSSVLEQYDMDIVYAENGKEAIEALTGDPEHFDLVLMDMMMPEMDGYEAMRLIREMPAFEKLPIIALTAKAMKEDRNKCIEAGASDYVSKPFQTEQLLSLMRVWLYK